MMPLPSRPWSARLSSDLEPPSRTEVFAHETGLRHLIRARDGIYGAEFQRPVEGIGLVEVPNCPSLPLAEWYAERFLGSSRRECLDHVIVLHERHVCRIVSNYGRYHHE